MCTVVLPSSLDYTKHWGEVQRNLQNLQLHTLHIDKLTDCVTLSETYERGGTLWLIPKVP